MTAPKDIVVELREMLKAAEGHGDSLDERYASPVARLHFYAARALPTLLELVSAADELADSIFANDGADVQLARDYLELRAKLLGGGE